MKRILREIAVAAFVCAALAARAQEDQDRQVSMQAQQERVQADAQTYKWTLGQTAGGDPLTVSFPSPSQSHKSLVIRTTPPRSNFVSAAEEDLSIMGRILDKATLAGGSGATQEAMGIRVATLGQGVPANVQIEGYGAIFFLQVNFPLLAPAQPAPVSTNAEPENSTWEEARRELYGAPARVLRIGSSRYDAARVAMLKNSLIQALKNASHLDIGEHETVTVTVMGRHDVSLIVDSDSPGANSGQVARRLYVVHEGDTMVSIARSLRVTIPALEQANPGLDPHHLTVGEKLSAPATAAPVPGTTPDPANQVIEVRGRNPGGATMTVTAQRMGWRDSETSVMTLRAEKSAIDAFAKGDLSFEQFRDRVSVVSY